MDVAIRNKTTRASNHQQPKMRHFFILLFNKLFDRLKSILFNLFNPNFYKIILECFQFFQSTLQ